MTSFKSELLACLICAPLLFASRLATAIPFTSSLAYRETFIGETVFPTAPDVDTLLAGGLIGSSTPNQTETPALAGFTATISVGLTTEWSQLTFLAVDAIGLADVGVRGSFENFEIFGPSGDGLAGLDLFFTGYPEHVHTRVDVSKVGVSLTGSFRVAHTDKFGTVIGEDVIPLPPGFADAIQMGDAFTVDLLVNRTGGVDTAIASLDIPGTGIVTTATIVLFSELTPPFQKGVFDFTTYGGGSQPVPIDDVDLELWLFEVYTDATLSPELVPALAPGAVGWLIAGLAIVGALLITRRAVRPRVW